MKPASEQKDEPWMHKLRDDASILLFLGKDGKYYLTANTDYNRTCFNIQKILTAEEASKYGPETIDEMIEKVYVEVPSELN
jgi:hypothetical protein